MVWKQLHSRRGRACAARAAQPFGVDVDVMLHFRGRSMVPGLGSKNAGQKGEEKEEDSDDKKEETPTKEAETKPEEEPTEESKRALLISLPYKSECYM